MEEYIHNNIKQTFNEYHENTLLKKKNKIQGYIKFISIFNST